jgi:uncharacterized protein (DUF1778 family)
VTPKAVRSERVMFRLTPDEYRQLNEWAKRERRSLSNLVYVLVGAALRDTMPSASHASPLSRIKGER